MKISLLLHLLYQLFGSIYRFQAPGDGLELRRWIANLISLVCSQSLRGLGRRNSVALAAVDRTGQIRRYAIHALAATFLYGPILVLLYFSSSFFSISL